MDKNTNSKEAYKALLTEAEVRRVWDDLFPKLVTFFCSSEGAALSEELRYLTEKYPNLHSSRLWGRRTNLTVPRTQKAR